MVCNKEESAITVALKTVYFFAQEGIALSKYTNMVKFLKKVGTPNLDSLNVNKRADYSSYNTAVDLLTALSDVIDEHIFISSSHNFKRWEYRLYCSSQTVYKCLCCIYAMLR
jgi:adenylate cyclase